MPLPAALLAAAANPYRPAGLFAYFFARSKLRMDPVYRAILEQGLLAHRECILDLGCGQGLLAAWLRAASVCDRRGAWPAAWPAPPVPSVIRGIELKRREVERARRALGPNVELREADIRTAEFEPSDAVVILDVLQYLDASAQRHVLERVRAALPLHGLLLLRVGDAGTSARFRFTQWSDRIIMLMRGHSLLTPCCRSIADWRALLIDCGFSSEPQPMSTGTPFANVLLIAHAVSVPVGKSPDS